MDLLLYFVLNEESYSTILLLYSVKIDWSWRNGGSFGPKCLGLSVHAF
jgi:hypothetical protein